MSDNNGQNSVEKALSIVANIVLYDGTRKLREIAHDLDMTVPTVYRHVAALQERGFLTQVRRGAYVPGLTLQAIAGHCSKREMVRKIARPILAKLARKLDGVCHMATWDDDMVTYIIKSESDDKDLFTQESTQLEGYCSGLGKVLLSTLGDQSLEYYLKAGEFMVFTENTITEPEKIREKIYEARQNKYALDNGEIQDDLFCVAVPIESDVLEFPLSISLSRANLPHSYWPNLDQDLRELRKAGKLIASIVDSVVAQ